MTDGYKPIVEELAYKIHEIRKSKGWEGYPDDDYFLAEGVIEQLIYLDTQIRLQVNYKAFV